jgi:Asp-tRNA(Asn)/Glu-tRNA(Gln) amidotransferase A subunit family amidase
VVALPAAGPARTPLSPLPSRPPVHVDGLAAHGPAELAGLVRAGLLSPVELVEAALAAIGTADRTLNAFVTRDGDRAVEAARRLADRIAAGEDPGPLAGIPIGVKDLEDVAGLRTSHGDPARGDAPPAARDSLQVARLRAAGAIVVGKTNTAAYGWTSETDNPLSGPTRNPWAPARTPGGSSGGSAAAVAAGMVPLATGSDGGGSIRIPASCCGLAGFKPTTGVVPAGDDAPPPWGHLSTRGVIAARFADVALALDVVAGPSHRDAMSLPALGSLAEAVAGAERLDGLRVAWAPTLGYATPTPPVLEVCRPAVKAIGGLGAHVERVDEILPADPVGTWLTLVTAGIRRDAERAHPDLAAPGRFDKGLAALLRRGAGATAADHLAALDACHDVTLALARVWEEFDVLACPVTADVAPPVGGRSVLGPGWVQYSYVFNLAGGPAASVPAGLAEVDGDRVPVGLQLAAPRLADRTLMRVAAALEAALA